MIMTFCMCVCMCVCGHWNVNHFPGGFDISVQDNGEGNSYGSGPAIGAPSMAQQSCHKLQPGK